MRSLKAIVTITRMGNDIVPTEIEPISTLVGEVNTIVSLTVDEAPLLKWYTTVKI